MTERLNKLENKNESPKRGSDNSVPLTKSKLTGKHRRIASLSPRRLNEARNKPKIWRRVQFPNGRGPNKPPQRDNVRTERNAEFNKRRSNGSNRSQSRPRNQQSPAVNTGYSNARGPRRPTANRDSTRRSTCPFCNRSSCNQPVECALRMPWDERMEVHRVRRLCPEFLCYKTHFSHCSKSIINCDFCETGKHHRIWCKALARRRNLL